MNIKTLWYSKKEEDWEEALHHYWNKVKDKNIELEKEMNALKISDIVNRNAEEWYDFLLNKYYRWKYTAPNRYATTTKQLARYRSEMDGLLALYKIKESIINLEQLTHFTIAASLKMVMQIHGLGISGASGLLSLIYPNYFGTVDQFVVKALRNIIDLPESNRLKQIKPEGISIKGGVLLIEIMRRKAQDNNKTFSSNYWTPRAIDMVLWGNREV